LIYDISPGPAPIQASSTGPKGVVWTEVEPGLRTGLLDE